jgi:hypothetical protein
VPDQEILQARFAREHSNTDVVSAYQEYRRFIELKITMGDYDATKLSPSPLIDSMWHLHILDIRRYEDMCSKLPSLIHHNPDGGNDAASRSKRYEATLFAYRARFGEAAPNAIWPHHLYQNDIMVFLMVKTPAGKTISVVADQSWCIKDVKFAIQKIEGIPPDQQRLIRGGTYLGDHYRLSSSNLRSNSTLPSVPE